MKQLTKLWVNPSTSTVPLENYSNISLIFRIEKLLKSRRNLFYCDWQKMFKDDKPEKLRHGPFIVLFLYVYSVYYNYYYELILKHTRGRYYYFVAKANVLPFCAMERLQVVLLSGSNFGGSTLHSIFQDLRSFKRQVLDLKHYILQCVDPKLTKPNPITPPKKSLLFRSKLVKYQFTPNKGCKLRRVLK